MVSFYVSMLVIIGLWCALNVVTMLAFAADKRSAILGQWRIPESTLLTLALFGGVVGAKLAQRWLPHKTRKQPFAGTLNMIAIGHVLLFAGLLYSGAWYQLVEGFGDFLELAFVNDADRGGTTYKPKRFGPGS